MSGTTDNDSISVNIPRLSLAVSGAGIEAYISGAIPAPALSEMSGYGTALANVDALIPVMSLEGGMLPGRLGSVDSLIPLLSLVVDSGGVLAGEIPALRSEISSFQGSSGAVFGRIPVLSLVVINQTGTQIDADSTIPALRASLTGLTGTVGYLSGPLPALHGASIATAGRTGSIAGEIPSMTLEAEHATGTMFTFSGLVPSMSGELIGGPPVTVATTVAPHAAVGTVSLCYVMNMKNFGLTSYSAFAADSIAIFKGKMLRADSLGLWENTTDLDNTAYIESRAKTGLSNMGVAAVKHLPEMMMDIRGSEETRVIVSTEQGPEYTYRIERFNQGGMQMNRVKCGRGLKAAYFAVELVNYRGDDLQINSVQPLPFGIQRKVG